MNDIYQITDSLNKRFGERYLTGEEAWKYLIDEADIDSKKVHDVWADPDDFPWAPFQYCTVSGLPESLDGRELDGRKVTIGCLTQIHKTQVQDDPEYLYGAENEEWDKQIGKDPLIPSLVEAYSDASREEFIAMWDRSTEYQLAMRQGRLPNVQ